MCVYDRDNIINLKIGQRVYSGRREHGGNRDRGTEERRHFLLDATPANTREALQTALHHHSPQSRPLEGGGKVFFPLHSQHAEGHAPLYMNGQYEELDEGAGFYRDREAIAYKSKRQWQKIVQDHQSRRPVPSFNFGSSAFAQAEGVVVESLPRNGTLFFHPQGAPKLHVSLGSVCVCV
jgi:hypothetical protein